MSKVVDIQNAEEPRDVIHTAVQQLSEGGLVALPSETTYVVACSALSTEGLAKLAEIEAKLEKPIYSLAVEDASAAFDYAPKMSEVGKRLCRRCWPGPVTLTFEEAALGGLTRDLPEECGKLAQREGKLRLAVPAGNVIQAISRLMPHPLVLLGSQDSDDPPSIASEAKRIYGESPGLLIDGGRCRYAVPPTDVSVSGDDWEVAFESVVTERTIRRLAAHVYLFVCTGNTCRSPMAEAMFRKMLADRLKCSEEELADRGYIVASAGIAAAMGGPPAAEAIKVMQSKGIDLNQHASQPLTGNLLQAADHLYTMTSGHRDSILYEAPLAEDRVTVLSRDGRDISDPIGYGIDMYQECADQIERNLQAILAEIFED